MSSAVQTLSQADDEALGSLGGGRWSADAQMTRVHAITPTLAELLGFSAERWAEEAGLWYARLHPLDRERVLRRRLEREDHVVDYRFVAADGRTVWLREAVRFGEEGISSVVLHVTASKEGDGGSDARLAAIVEGTQDAIYATTLGGLVTDWNDGAARLFGYRADEVVGRRVTLLLPPERTQQDLALLGQIARGERVPPMETDMVRKGGRVVPVALSLSPIRDADQRVIGVSAIARDLTETMRVQRRLLQGEAALAKAQALAHLGSWSWDLESGRIEWSDEQCRIHGLAPKSAPGLDDYLALVHPEDAALVAATLEGLLHGPDPGQVAEMAYRIERADGHTRWISGRAELERDDHGRPRTVLGTCLDVTDVRAAEIALQQRAGELARLTMQLARSNGELDQFAYIASHDLKAPLRGIANVSRWIEEDLADKLSEESRGHLDLLRGRVVRMEALIDAILEYSRVGRVRVRPELVDVGALLAEVVDLVAPPDGFTVRADGQLPTFVAERMRLQQVLMNLVSNAVKHHHDKARGEVVVSAEDAGAFWRFRVRDNGPGIDPRFHEKIFVVFQTLETRDKVEGTGIGLALVKKIVEGYGGEIAVESDVGRGATFRFTWPKTTPDARSQ